MKQPTKAQLKAIIKDLERALNESENGWSNNKPHPYIIGYLQGAIKSTIIDLKTLNNGNN